jgi:dTDP-4-dehydrorhamnose reductase
MKILVLGCSGMLGSMLNHCLVHNDFNVFGCCRNTNRLKQSNHYLLNDFIKSRLLEIKVLDDVFALKNLKTFDIIFNCLGYIKQRDCDNFEMYKINASFPGRLDDHLKNSKTKLVHISTDCVFDGITGNYTEHSIPNPLDNYGLSKYIGEQLVYNGIIFRTSIIGPEIYNKLGLLEWVLNNPNMELSGFTNAIYSGINTYDLSKFLMYNLETIHKTKGLFHIGSEKITKYDLLNIINKKYNLNKKIVKVSNVCIDRSFTCKKIHNKFQFSQIEWNQQIENLVKLQNI